MDKLQYLVKTFSRTTKKDYENYVVNAIYQRVGNLDLQPVTQQYVRRENGYAKIDLYFPQIGIAVEVDEAYHLSETQTQRDKEREREITEKLKKDERLAISAISLGAEAFRHVIVAFNDTDEEVVGWEEVERQINAIVKEIQEIISQRQEPLRWNVEEGKMQAIRIRKSGKLKVGDGFKTVSQILSAFGKEIENPQRCFFYSDSGKDELWSPTLSVLSEDGQVKNNGSDWINIINFEGGKISEITEEYVGNDKSKVEHRRQRFEMEKHRQLRRFTFAHSKDELGIDERRFIGTFIADSMENGADGDANTGIIHYKREPQEEFSISGITFDKFRKVLQNGEQDKIDDTPKIQCDKEITLQELTKKYDIFAQPENIEEFMIIKVRQKTVEDRGNNRYKATHFCWQLKLDSVKKINYVLSVTDGVVKEIYHVDHWKEVTEETANLPDEIGRVMFEGIVETDSTIRNRFLNKMIPEKYRKKGMASPCLYCKK